MNSYACVLLILNRRAAPDQRMMILEDYLYEYCNFGCAYFVVNEQGNVKKNNASSSSP